MWKESLLFSPSVLVARDADCSLPHRQAGREGSGREGRERVEGRAGMTGDGRPHRKPLVASSQTTGRAEMLAL